MNYLIVNPPSNLIINVISTSYKPQEDKTRKPIQVSDKQLDTYYQLLSKIPRGDCLDFGLLLHHCPGLFDQISGGRKTYEQHQESMAIQKLARHNENTRRRLNKD